ncbi:DHH family phosphoesterase [Candidatus Peregrinibacteria bacterium]|nr:DHH family phosphoesterase [Candidatus Peregrinibacteria bacterium]
MPLSLTGKRWSSPTYSYDGFSAFTDALIEKRNLSCPPALNIQPAFHAGVRATMRIENAIEHHEHIGIFGDYDCDGITSSAMMSRFFERRGIRPFIRLPLRSEGYGLRKEHVDVFRAKNVSLLVTLDTGITANHAIEYANAHNINVIIVDHHILPASLPPAYAIIHPLLADSPLTPSPAAAGLCYLLVRLLEKKEWEDHRTDLALACLGTIADLVELKGFNRTIAKAGLQAWNNLPNGALKELKISIGLQGHVSSTDIAFRIAPRVNAPGRMDDPSVALAALLHGGAPIRILEELNTQRQTYVKNIYAGLPDVPLAPFICLAHKTYHPGIIGLLAGKLTERFHRPSLVAHILNDICTASLRSIPAFNVVHALEMSKELLIHFGGHAQAAGCTFEYKNFVLLQQQLSQYASQTLPPSALVPSLTIDAELSPRDVTLEFCEDLRRLEPFGQGNPEPHFLLRDISALQRRQVGSDGQHLQLHINNTASIGFGLGKFLPYTLRALDIVCHIGINNWRGVRTPQITIEDLREASSACFRQEQACPL